MFHGGTDFGFMNGANKLDNYPEYGYDISSYGKLQLIIKF